ncbi:MAG: hypothetical protein ACOYON_11835 [Fimbriimonas sp.]
MPSLVSFLGLIGLGGLAGALGALLVAGMRLERSWTEVVRAWQAYGADSTGPRFGELTRRIEAFEGEFRGLREGLARLRQTLDSRKR